MHIIKESHGDTHDPSPLPTSYQPPVMRPFPHLYGSYVYLLTVSLSLVSITDQSLFKTCVWVQIALVVILRGEILSATTRSVHLMDELLQPAAWQTLITARVSLD